MEGGREVIGETKTQIGEREGCTERRKEVRTNRQIDGRTERTWEGAIEQPTRTCHTKQD